MENELGSFRERSFCYYENKILKTVVYILDHTAITTTLPSLILYCSHRGGRKQGVEDKSIGNDEKTLIVLDKETLTLINCSFLEMSPFIYIYIYI